MTDSAKKFLITASGFHLGTTFLEDTWEKDILGTDHLYKFLNNGICTTLYSYIEEEEHNKRLRFTTQIPPNTSSKTVIYSKDRPTVLNDDNVSTEVQTTSVIGSPILALYNTLNNVYSPLLINDGENGMLKKQILVLQADLRSLILSSNSELSSLIGGEDISIAVVRSLEHEVEYWENAIKIAKNSISKHSCASFRNILEPLAKEFGIIDALPTAEVEEVLENGHNILDDLWRQKPGYPIDRMKNLMEIIANGLTSYILKQLKQVNVWTKEYNFIFDFLTQDIMLGEKWLTTCTQLTQLFWPNYAENAWVEQPYEPKDLKYFIKRLQAVLNIRTVHKQLMRLLTSQEQIELDATNMFSPFLDLDIFVCEEHTDIPWLKAQKDFERVLKPAEQRVAFKLQKQLSSINVNTRQLLYEFSRYSELISRPILKQTLQSERQFLLSSLYDYVHQLQTQTTADMAFHGPRFETPLIVKELVMTRQLESRAKEVQTTSEKLLSDLQDYENLKHIVAELLKDLKKQHTELFDSWTSEITSRINDNSLSLRESDPVIAFSKNKLMRVNYSPRLVLLINEVRQLTALGYNVPKNIQETSQHAKQFMRFAKILEQVASFHNTIGDRMITSQRPMMLAGALGLSKLVQEQEVVSWGETQSVEKYVETLKNAVEELSRQNNLLTSYHFQIMDKIKPLSEVDLIKEYNKWKESVKYVKNIIFQVEEKGFQKMQNWINDIATNLSDVLEKQYIKSLDKLHLYLPEIYADLIYRYSELQFSPSEADLKVKYDQQLRKFLDIPKNFHSIFEYGPNVFAGIIEKTAPHLKKVSVHTEELFHQLREVIKYWQGWLQIGALDISKLSTWQHWDVHFKVSKTFGQEIAKLPSSEEKVGCFLIGLSRLRSDLESHNRSYWDQLMSSLKDSIAQDVVKLQNYVDPSTAVLTKHPVTLEEISESGALHANIIKQIPEMEEVYSEMNRKCQTLASWTRDQVEPVNRLKGAWERLQSLLENHQHIIAKQMETIRTTLNIESENLTREMERFGAKWEQVKTKPNTGQISASSFDDLQKQLESIKTKQEQWKELLGTKQNLISDYEKYDMAVPVFPLSDEIENDLTKEESAWKLFEEFNEGLLKLSNEEWIVFRKKIYNFEEFLNQWLTKLKTVEQTDLVTRILQEINKFEVTYQSLKYVRGEDFTEKHWLNVFDLIGLPSKPIDILKLCDFLGVSDNMVKHTSELQSICKKAASEIVIRQALAELDQWDVQARFILILHTDSREKKIMLVKDFKQLMNKIGDHQSLLQSVKNSADYESFSERATSWEIKLVDLDYYLSSLVHIQRKWLYLEPIFGGGTLEQEKMRFEKVNKDVHYIFSNIEKDPRVSAMCRYPNLRSLFENVQDQLSRCQNSLDNFLAEKRNKFPRFFFLGDDDLLEVVGQSSKEQVIQSHLKKIFAGINSVILDTNGTSITSICSLQGEIVKLTNTVNITRPVEEWLNNIVKEMQVTLKDLLVRCLEEGQAADPSKYPSQILCLADNITFTLKCEQAVCSMTLPPLLAVYKAQLAHYSSLELNADVSEKSTAPLNAGIDEETNVLELKLKALVLDTIHHISVLEELLEVNLTKITEWTWQKQLRFYSNSLGEITVKMANARMEYAYEYLGNSAKLVRTPLTDQCFLTLTQGIHLGMGGNPYGPAGTGKTESVKALGGLLGRQVLVFNCDEGIDAASMARILSGLVRSGAWGCFDEFNRLDEATLSAISVYIHLIQVALRKNLSLVTLSEQEIQVNKHCGIFVTLNPAGGGYGGRNKLPDNLKQLFRPVVMTHPDQEHIARSLLQCDGYQHANVIGKKLIEVFSLASKLLSKQQHYDWGLRALRTVLTGCGRAKKQYMRHSKKSSIDMGTELSLSMQVLKMDTLSKLTFADSVKFGSIVGDVFKGIIVENLGNDILIKALEECYVEMGLKSNKRQLDKCLELHEQLKQRMGVAIVGPPSSGKTTIRNLLHNALLKMSKTINQHVFNPKCITRNQLLGQIDNDTRQWTDGILTLYSLQVASEPLDIWSWIVCDGDIDPEWVESLNSVMDDNRLLSLPSGWRIQFGPNVNFLFETHNLNQASPATISRMGIVLLSDEDLSMIDYIDNRIQEQVEHVEHIVGPLVQDNLLRVTDWLLNEGDLTMPCSKMSIVNTGLSVLTGVKTKNEFTVALVNGLGQLLQFDFRELFAQQVFEWLDTVSPPSLLKLHYSKERDLIDTHHTSPNITFDNVSNKLPLVHTGQIQRALDVLRIWLLPNQEQHFLLVGAHGCSKTLVINFLVNERSDVEMITFHCNAKLQPTFVISKIMQTCITVNTNKGKMYKPKKGHLILYFKNLHLLKSDKWGTNILIEFLYQLIMYKAFFDVNLELVILENFTIIGSLMASKNISSRFTSNVHIYNMDLPETEDSTVMMVSYLCHLINTCISPESHWPKAKVTKLVLMMQTVYDKIRNTFSVSHQQHYCFNSHDLIKWCSNILRYKEENIENLEDYMLSVICYESIKLFGERLVDSNDFNKFEDIINTNFQRNWEKNNMIRALHEFYYVPLPQFARAKENTVLTKLDKTEWSNMIEKGIMQYEREGHTLDSIINDDLLSITSSISKVVTSEGGHMVLVGRSGIGRRCGVRIISSLYSAKLNIPVSTMQPQFNNDLKSAVQYAGIDGEEIYLVLEDHILTNEDVLSCMNTLIASGEVPNLYNTSELNALVMGLSDEANIENFEGSLIQFFTNRVKKHLHVIICLDVDNEKIHDIFETCPSFMHNCTIIWKVDICASTIENLPKLIIERFNNRNMDKTMKVQNTEYISNIFNLARSRVPSPRKYISLIKLYIALYTDKTSDIISKQNKLKAGVGKLTDARNLVAELKEKASLQQRKLAEKQSKANSALDMISATMKNANSHKEQMESLKMKTEGENVLLMKRKKEIEAELSEVEPLIQEARSAVGNIKTEALSEIRSLRAPPDVIRDILEGVLRLMGIQDTSWNSMKTFLAKRGVKEDIRSFDASRITTESRQSVERLISMKADSFDPKSAKRASIAAVPLATWVTANVKYSRVMDKIKPLEREQYKLKQNLNNTESQLGELSADLLSVDEKVAKLKMQLSAYTKEAAEVEIELNKAQKTLGAAEGLVAKLNDEYERWQEQLTELSIQMDKLSTNCLLASAFITYLSGESEDERSLFVENCLNILGEDSFSFEEFLSSEREHMLWHSEGLSNDRLSMQNAIIVLKTNVVPLLVDPTSNATNWIKTNFKNKQLECMTQSFPNFTNVLELSVRFGKVLIVEEVETVSPILFSVLRQQLIYQGERKLIPINGKLVDFHNDFQLILISRNDHIKLPAGIEPMISTMNFAVTHAGLTEQLLTVAIMQENPELEERRKALLREREELQEKQHRLQSQLLEDLANSSGDILQNSNLLTSLNETKASSLAISIAITESTTIQSKLQEEYDVYRDISAFGSSFYFAANEFSKYNILYVLSVTACTRLFLKSLETSQSMGYSLDSKKNHLLNTVYNFMARGIFKEDRMKFALHLLHKMFPEKIPPKEWNVFLENSISNSRTEFDDLPDWLPKQSSIHIQSIQNWLPDLYKILQLKDHLLWKSFLITANCEINFPTHCKLSDFQKVLVVQALRPDRLYSAISQCVASLIDPPVLDLLQIYKESINTEPILLITTSGNDPSSEIMEVIQNTVGMDGFEEIAMGEGQEDKAVIALHKAAKSGKWLILKNLHLVTSWLPILCQNLQISHHESFRLWLVTEPHDNFSFVLAQNSLKIAYEAPKGIKNNLQKTYLTFGPKYIEELAPTAGKILFVLSCVHAILQERRTYIPQGWSKYYEFSDADLATCVKLVEEVWQNNSVQIQWKIIEGLCCSAVYGGRIENIEDMQVLRSYLREYFTDNVLSYRWKPFGLNITLPNSPKFEDYLNIINQFPSKESPTYYGLPDNIDRACQIQKSSAIIRDLKSLYLSKQIAKQFEFDAWHKGLSPFMTLWKKLNQGLHFIRMPLPAVINGKPLETFVSEECHYAVSLVQKVHKSFATLNRICKGLTSPNKEELTLGNSLLSYKTPKVWLDIWEGPDEPIKYIRDTLNKVINLMAWKEGQIRDLLEQPIRMSFMFHPEAFLASYKLEFSRQSSIPLDQLIVITSWSQSQNTKSLALADLLIEGALFDGKSLQTCTSNSENINNVPNCYLYWKEKGIVDNEENYLNVPLYYTSNRKKQVISLQIPCDRNKKDTWIQAAVAFFLEQ